MQSASRPLHRQKPAVSESMPEASNAQPAASDVEAAIASRLDDMDSLVAAGDWERIESLLKRLPQLLMRIPATERRAVTLTMRSRIERVREQVLERSNEIGNRLATLKTGQQAAASYRATSAA